MSNRKCNCRWTGPDRRDTCVYCAGYVDRADYDALTARVEELERDAARYRYMRAAIGANGMFVLGNQDNAAHILEVALPEDLDLCIDAALGQPDRESVLVRGLQGPMAAHHEKGAGAGGDQDEVHLP